MNFVEKNLGRWFTVDMGFEQSYPDKFRIERSGGDYTVVIKKEGLGFDMYAGSIQRDEVGDNNFKVWTMTLGHLVSAKIDISRIQFCDDRKEAVAC